MKKIFLAAFIALSLSACNEDEDRLANDDLRGDRIAGFAQSVQSVSYFQDLGQVTVNVPVTLLGLGTGEAPSEPVEITYEVDAAGSTAVEGTEYSFADNTRKITIPAGSTFANIPLLVNTGSLNESAATRVVLNLTQASTGTVVLQSAKQVAVTFVGCLADLAGTYTAVTVNQATMTSFTRPNEVVIETGVNSFRTSNTGTFNPGQAPDPSRQGYNFNVLCGEVDVPSQGLFDGQYPFVVVGLPDAEGLDGEVINDNVFVTRIRAQGGATTYFNWITTYTRI